MAKKTKEPVYYFVPMSLEKPLMDWLAGFTISDDNLEQLALNVKPLPDHASCEIRRLLTVEEKNQLVGQAEDQGLI